MWFQVVYTRDVALAACRALTLCYNAATAAVVYIYLMPGVRCGADVRAYYVRVAVVTVRRGRPIIAFLPLLL